MKSKTNTGSRVQTETMSSTDESIQNALKSVDYIRSVWKNLKSKVPYGASVESLVTKLSKAEGFLNLITDANGLPNSDFRIELGAIATNIQDSKLLFDQLVDPQTPPLKLENNSYVEQLKSKDSQLDTILRQLSPKVLKAPVGLQVLGGSYSVALGVLKRTNAMVRELLGENLAIMNFLMDRKMIEQKVVPDEAIAFTPDDIEAYRHFSQISNDSKASRAAGSKTISGEYTRVDISGNITGDKMKVIAGHVGAESGYVSSYQGTIKFHNNRIGNNGGLIAGDVVGEVAVKAMEKFWD
ncbi:hypothetical protein GGI43DRAFT_414866 [Trichoderma evansii]